MNDLFAKLQEARTKIEEAKTKLNSLIVEVEAEGGGLRVKASANKMITGIEVSTSFSQDKTAEEISAILLLTINKALELAALEGEREMKKITADILPGFPGLGD